MDYEMLFWAMLITVSTAIATGALTAVWLAPPRSILACLLIALVTAAALTFKMSRAGLETGGPLVAIAAFMFFSVIATALSLLVTRMRRA